jgi:hypothetical protein
MFNRKHFSGVSSLGNRYLRDYFPYVFIIFIIGLTRFSILNTFGLYEDDWAFTGNAITKSFSQNISGITSAFQSFWQGRPLHMTFIIFFASLGGYLGSLKALYIIGFLILCVNALLLYELLKKIFEETFVSLIITLFFCVYPADTTFNYLQHLFGIQTSLLLVLISFHFYFSRYRNISYVWSALSLLTYESIFLIFSAAPFFLKTNSKRITLTHFIKIFIILTVYATFRKLLKEQRLDEVNIISTLIDVTRQVSLGPLISFSTFLSRPVNVVLDANLFDVFIIFSCSILLFFILLMTKESTEVTLGTGFTRFNKEVLRKYRRFILIGYGMVVLAYPTVITLSIYETSGRASRVHFAAAFGASLVVGCLWIFFLKLSLSRRLWNKLILLLLSLHLVLLAAFCINVQYFYKISWDYQRAFWTDIYRLAPDIEDGTVILVNSPSLQRYGKEINPFDWSVPSVLGSIYKFPSDWKKHPRLYLMNSYENDVNPWQEFIVEDSHLLLSGKNNSLTYYYAWEPDRIVDSNDSILIEEEDNRLVRRDSIRLGNSLIEFKTQSKPDSHIADLTKSILFDELISYDGDTNNKLSLPIYFKPQR